MRALLDTHAFLWFILDDPRLSSRARSIIADTGNVIAVSPACLWEIAIKISLGKYSLNVSFGPFMEEQMGANRLELLPILVPHLAVLTTLPFHHRDPFDRLLIAQTIAEGFPILSSDAKLDAYQAARIW